MLRSRVNFCTGFRECEFVGDVIFLDITDVLNRFLTNLSGNYGFDIAKPLIRIQTFVLGTPPAARNPLGPAL